MVASVGGQGKLRADARLRMKPLGEEIPFVARVPAFAGTTGGRNGRLPSRSGLRGFVYLESITLSDGNYGDKHLFDGTIAAICCASPVPPGEGRGGLAETPLSRSELRSYTTGHSSPVESFLWACNTALPSETSASSR